MINNDKPKVQVYWEAGQEPEELTRKEDPKKSVNSSVKVFWEDGAIPESKKVGKPSGQNAAVYPEEIATLVVAQGELYRRRCKLSNYLVDLPEDAPLDQTKPIVDAILSTRNEYNLLAEQKKKWETTGELPSRGKDKPKMSEMEKHELMKTRLNIAPNVSKTRNLIKKYQHQPEKVVKYQIKLAQLEAELHQIDELLRK